VLKLGLAKKPRSIGVSNYSIPKLKRILALDGPKPVINQVECHVGFRQEALVAFCQAQGVHVTAYCPLGRPDGSVPLGPGEVTPLEEPIVLEIAKRLGKSPGQVLLRYLTMRGLSVVPKSVHAVRLAENMDCTQGWSLSVEDVEMLKVIPQRRIVMGKFYVGPKFTFKTLEDLWDA